MTFREWLVSDEAAPKIQAISDKHKGMAICGESAVPFLQRVCSEVYHAYLAEAPYLAGRYCATCGAAIEPGVIRG